MLPEADQSRWILEARDRRGRVVRYSRSNYEGHLLKHPEMMDQVEAVRRAVEDPDIEIEADNGHLYLYRTGVGQGKYSKLWLFVVVKYEGSSGEQEGIIKTAFFTSKTSRDGRVTWKRSDL